MENYSDDQKQLKAGKDKQQCQFHDERKQHKPKVFKAAQLVKQVELAATAISLNVRLRCSSNMPPHMQDRALRRTRSLIDDVSAAPPKTRPNPTHLARALKKEFDMMYGPAWHCVVGKSFGSFVTHSPGGFLYFSVDESLSVLLFKTEVHLVTEQQQQQQQQLAAK